MPVLIEKPFLSNSFRTRKIRHNEYILRVPLIIALHSFCIVERVWTERLPFPLAHAHCSRSRAMSHIPKFIASSEKFAAFGEQIQFGSNVSSRWERLKNATTAAPVLSDSAFIWRNLMVKQGD